MTMLVRQVLQDEPVLASNLDAFDPREDRAPKSFRADDSRDRVRPSGSLSQVLGTSVCLSEMTDETDQAKGMVNEGDTASAPAKLGRPEEELQQLIDSVPQILVELGPDGRWIHANRVAREYTGLTLEEYRTLDIGARVIHPDDIREIRVARKGGFQGTQPFEFEARLLRNDGVYRWFLFRYRPLIQDGRVLKWYGSATEFESRKQEEEKARKEIVRLEERTRIAQELHDTLLQSFFLASLQLGIAMSQLPCESGVRSELNSILELLEQGIEDGRNAILDLRSPDYANLNLSQAFQLLPQQLGSEAEVEISTLIIGTEWPLPPTKCHEVYRIGREAVVNAYRHSGSKMIEIRLEYVERELCMRVLDGGRGIDPLVLASGRSGHCGLAGMRERAVKIGGDLRITSDMNGTEVTLTVPNAFNFGCSGHP
jgi:PAS domain S-box-containing protein